MAWNLLAGSIPPGQDFCWLAAIVLREVTSVGGERLDFIERAGRRLGPVYSRGRTCGMKRKDACGG
jgi:hypothetical protein